MIVTATTATAGQHPNQGTVIFSINNRIEIKHQ
jgi:hypothetical protein